MGISEIILYKAVFYRLIKKDNIVLRVKVLM